MATESIGGGIGSAVGGLATLIPGLTGKGGDSSYRQAVNAWKKLKESNYDYRSLSAPELRVVAQMLPEVYTAVVPPEVQRIVEAPEGREAQLTSLGQMQDIAEEGLPEVDRLSQMKASESALQSGRQLTDTALQSLAARGRIGGGSELAARMSAGSAAANSAASMGAENAANAALRRMSAIGQAGQMGGQLRSADLGVEQANKNYAERFNELVSGLKTQQARDAAAARGGAQDYNVKTAQDVANTNKMNQYQTALANLERQNKLRSTAFGERQVKTAGLSGAYAARGKAQDEDRAAIAQGITNLGAGVGLGAGKLFGF